jgi:hypothetical protein
MNRWSKRGSSSGLAVRGLCRLEALESRVLCSGTITGGISLGGQGGEDHLQAVVVDARGTRYVTGYFQGTLAYGSGPSAGTLTSSGGNDIVVMKVTTAGDVVWARQFGGAGSDSGVDVYFDPAGGIVIAGNFEQSMSVGSSVLTSAGGSDGFLLRLDVNGGVVWARQFGGQGDDFAGKLISDKHGGYFLDGAFSGVADLDPGAGTHTLTSAGENDLFLEKLDQHFDLVWVDTFAHGTTLTMTGLAADRFGNAIVGGGVQGEADLDPGAGVKGVATASELGWVAMYGGGVGRMIWAKTFGNGGTFSAAWVSDVAVDASGKILLGGDFGGTADFDPGSGVHTLTETVSPDGFSGFVLALDGMGNYVSAAAIKGDWWTDVTGITADGIGNFYVTGEINSEADFNPLGPAEHRTSSSGNNDGFVAKYDVHGRLVWVQLLQGTSISMMQKVVVGPGGELAGIGYFQGDVTVGRETLSAQGSADALLATVVQTAASTTLTLGGIGTSAVTGQVVRLTATVDAAVGTPGGLVVFRDGSRVLGTAALDGAGVATLVISMGGTGAHVLWASFAGDVDFAASSVSKSVAVAANVLPAGRLEIARRTGIAGWAVDAGSPGVKLAITVLVDGVIRATGVAGAARAGLAWAGHGFAIALPALGAGAHRVAAYAVDAESGRAVLLGAAWVF